MIEQKTELDEVCIKSSGVVLIRFRKAFLVSGEERAFEYHRATLQPGEDHVQMFADLNKRLGEIGDAPVAQPVIARIGRIIASL